MKIFLLLAVSELFLIFAIQYHDLILSQDSLGTNKIICRETRFHMNIIKIQLLHKGGTILHSIT